MKFGGYFEAFLISMCLIEPQPTFYLRRLCLFLSVESYSVQLSVQFLDLECSLRT